MYEEPIESLSDRLREAMYIRDVSAAEISRNTNISTAAISRYLHGDYVPKQDNTYALATYLRVNPAWLMGYDVEMDGKTNNNDTSNTTNNIEDCFAQDYSRIESNLCPLPILLDRMKQYPSVQNCSDPAEQARVLLTAARLILQKGYETKFNHPILSKFNSLDKSSQLLVEGMIDKLLLTQQMAQKNATTADSDGGEDSGTQKGTPSLQQVPFCEKVK